MRPSQRASACLFVASVWLCSACDVGRRAIDEISSSSIALQKPAAAKARPGNAATSEALRERAGRWTQTFTAPSAPAERPCPALLGTESPGASVLVRRVSDARLDGKTLLPLKLRREIESRDLERLDEALRLGVLDAAAGPEPRSNAFEPVTLRGAATSRSVSVSSLVAALERLELRRFMGVYHVVDYREPQLIYNMQKNKRQWTRGSFRAWLSVYPAANEGSAQGAALEPICTTLVQVETDSAELPTSRRRREETQQRLLQQLAATARSASPAALRKISEHLVFAD